MRLCWPIPSLERMPRLHDALRRLISRDPDLLKAILVFLLLVIAWAPDALLGQGVYLHHDLRHHHLPWRVWAAGEWLSGHVPGWCPGVANGYPLMADAQVGALYPPTMLLFALLPAPLAMNYSVLGHAFWAALCTFLLARALGRSTQASLLAGVAFAFGGFFVSHTLYLGMQNAMSWLPFTLWALVRATETRVAVNHGRFWVLTSLGLFLMAVAGHPQVAVMGWLLAGLVLLWRTWPSWRAPGRLVAFAFAALAAAMMASPQIAASLELSHFSMREGGVADAFAGIGSLPPQELINSVLPTFFGLDRPADIAESYFHRGLGYWGSGENHWEMCFFLGIPTVLLALLALHRTEARFWIGLSLLALLLMLGRYTPLWGLVRHLPGLEYFRFPVRFALYLSLASALLAAIGLDTLREQLSSSLESERLRLKRWMFLVLALGLLAAGGLLSLHALLQAREPLFRATLEAHFLKKTSLPPLPQGLSPLQAASLPSPSPLDPAELPARVESILGSLHASTSPFSGALLIPLAMSGLLLIGVLIARKKPRTIPFVVSGLVCLLFLDLYLFGHDYHPRVPSELLSARPPLLDHLEPSSRDYRVAVVDRRVEPELDFELMNANLGLLHGLSEVIVPSPLMLVRNDLFLGLAGLDIGPDKGPIKTERLKENLALASLLGVRYLLSKWPIDDPRLEEVLRPGQEGSRVWAFRNPEAFPLAFLVSCVRPVSSPEDSLKALETLLPAFEAIVEPEGVPISSELLACEAGALPEGSTRLRWHDARAWQIRVETRRDALLVISESYFPGWRAQIDGIEAPILRTNLILRGVQIPAGKHLVDLRYEPSWQKPAWLAFFTALMGLLAVSLLSGKVEPLPPSLPSMDSQDPDEDEGEEDGQEEDGQEDDDALDQDPESPQETRNGVRMPQSDEANTSHPLPAKETDPSERP